MSSTDASIDPTDPCTDSGTSPPPELVVLKNFEEGEAPPSELHLLALDYAERLGLAVFPLAEKSKMPLYPRWNPKWGKGHLCATRDPEIINEWWGANPNANIGIRTVAEEDGIVAIDLDRHDPDKDGVEAWYDIENEYGIFDTLMAVTGSDGRHLLARVPEGRMIHGKSGTVIDKVAGIDFKYNGYIVAPGSTHPETRQLYRFINDEPIAELPDWFFQEPDENRTFNTSSLGERQTDADFDAFVKQAQIDGFPVGERDNSFHNLVRDLKWWRYDEDEAEAIVEAVWEATEKTSHDTSPVDKVARIYNDFRYEVGPPKPRFLKIVPTGATSGFGVAEDDVLEFYQATDGLHMTDDGNGLRLIAQAEDRLRYVPEWQKWLAYDEGVFNKDDANVFVGAVVRQVAKSLHDTLPDQWMEDSEGETVQNPAYKAQLKFALLSESQRAARDMITKARSLPGVTVDHEALDANPELLNVKNCTINLRTSEARPHDPADLMTMQSPTVYDPEAKFEASLWEACLERWQPDPEKRRYLQIRAGACATGIATETLDIDYGEGSNGKSKFHGAVMEVLGAYAVVPHKSLLVEEKHDQHPTVLATLFRARMAVAGELDARSHLNEAVIKNITGGDRIGARHMREDEWFFAPSHTLIVFSNYQPVVKRTDEGIWRRVRFVSWDVTIPEAERDAELAEKLRAEHSIILNWIIEGARLFYEAGCKVPVPESIRVATDEYRAAEDVVGRFMAECLSFDNPGERTTTAAITSLAEQWMRDQGHKWTLNPKDIASALSKAGAKNIGRVLSPLGRRETTWQGVGLAKTITV